LNSRSRRQAIHLIRAGGIRFSNGEIHGARTTGSLDVSDADATFARAVEAGATVVLPLANIWRLSPGSRVSEKLAADASSRVNSIGPNSPYSEE
jgi:hypothetical protein